MKLKFTARRQKKATIKASKQTVEQAIQEANLLVQGWMDEDANDPRIPRIEQATQFLSSILNKNPQQMAQDGVQTVEEYFDDATKPEVANKVKQEIDMIARWRRDARPGKTQQTTGPIVQQAPAVKETTMASAKKADGGAAFTTDRDEQGKAKAPEKLEVPRLAAKDKKAAPVAAAPAPAPVAPSAEAPIPEDGSFDIKLLSSEALAKAIKALTSIKEFESDKSAQALIEAMAQELKTRPVEQEAPKAAPAAAAPAAAPAPIPAPVASRKKRALDSPAQAPVSLGGLNTAAPESGDAPVTASAEKVAVTPPGISEELMHKLKKEYPGEPDKAYATAWKIHNEKAGSEKTAVAPPGREEQVKALKKERGIDNPYAVAWHSYNESKAGGASEEIAVTAAVNAAFSWNSETGKVEEGSIPEVGEAHSKIDESPARLDRPATELPEKFAADMTTGKAVKEAERLCGELKNLYLGAKAITNVNDSRPVREAVECIFHAADLFSEAEKVLNKQHMQEEEEAAAARIKEENKGKKGSFGGLALAAGE